MTMRALCTLALLGVFGLSAAAEMPLACRTSMVPLKYRLPVEDLATGVLPLPDYQEVVFKCRNTGLFGMPTQPPPTPASASLISQRAGYLAALSAQPADVLVVPFQVQGYGLDRIERAVMTADVAYAIGDAGALRVADPFFTALALGEGERRFDPGAVESLAQKIGARWILTGYVGHDLKHAFTLSLELKDARPGAGSKPWRQDWRSVAFTDAKMPAYVLHEKLPDLLKALPLNLSPKVAAAGRAPVSPAHISVSPTDFISDGPGAGPPQAAMTLLAALVPGDAELARERLFERALVAAMRANLAQPSHRFLEAYTLLNLYRRPQALSRIDGATGSRFTALRALLNGDLPSAKSATREVANPFDRLLLEFLVRDMEYDYRVEEPEHPVSPEALFGSVSIAWLPLYSDRFEERDGLFVRDAASVKAYLDRMFPMQGFALGSVVGGAKVMREASADEVDIDLASIRHMQKVTTTLPSLVPCCHTRDLLPGRWDLAWLLQGVAENRVTGSLQKRIFIQADARRAFSAIARYEPLLKGNPLFTALSASAMHRIAANSPDDERGNWTERGLEAGRAAIRWSPGQNRVSYLAALSLGIPSPDSELWLDVYGYDYPRRPDWPLQFLGMEDPAGEAQLAAFVTEAIAFTTSDLRVLGAIGGARKEALIASLGGRFAGNPARPVAKPASAAAGDSTPEARIAAARVATKDDPTAYCTLGDLLLHSEHPLKESRDAYLACPTFKTQSVRNAILLSNVAADVGSTFFWLGEAQLAEPFYQISADLETGSDGSLQSEQRLQLLGGNLARAAEIARYRAVRYSSSFAQRDHLSLLHAFGQHEAAWNGFSQLWPEQGDPALWTSALVGHRMQKLDDKAVRAWLRTPEIRNAKVISQFFASYYALLWSSTDRVPPADLGAFVEELEGPYVAQVDTGGVIRPHPVDTSGFELVRATFVPAGVPSVQTLPEGTKLKSERAYFAGAYSALVRGEYEQAVKDFAAMAGLYPVDGAAMPYFAYAASKTGDAFKFETHVMKPRPRGQEDFDVLLSRAFFAAGRKQVEDAYRLLNLAFRAKPYDGLRAVDVHYQFAQACEWLYRDTHDRRFAMTLLKWAKDYQSVQPTAAWGYAVQFQYETNPAERIRALAMTLYLDPLSDRIGTASKGDLDTARAWLAGHNPFAREKDKSEEETTRVIALAIQPGVRAACQAKNLHISGDGLTPPPGVAATNLRIASAASDSICERWTSIDLLGSSNAPGPS